jgi:hypothetical protein
MENLELVKQIRNAVAAYAAVAPQQLEFLNYTESVLEREIERGARKTALKRLHSEFMTCAKNVLTPRQLAAFKTALNSGESLENDKGILDRVLLKGAIDSTDEFRKVMESLDMFIQSGLELTKSDEEKVHAVNLLLANFERNPKPD